MATDELFPLRQEQAKGKDLMVILSQYLKYWYWLLLGGSLGAGAAFLYLHYYDEPQYRVHSTLLIKDDSNGQRLSSADAFNDLPTFMTNSNLDNEMEVLKARGLMTRVVSKLGLVISYYQPGQIHDYELYGGESPIEVLVSKPGYRSRSQNFTIYLKPGGAFNLADGDGPPTSHRLGQLIRKPYGSFTIVATGTAAAETQIIVRFDNLQQVAEYYNESVEVQLANKNASVLVLSLVDAIPAKAEDIINTLMSLYAAESIEDKNLIAKNTLLFLDERLRYLTGELSEVEKVVEQYKSANGLTDISTQATIYSEQASSYKSQLAEWAIQIDVLESIEKYLQRTSDRYAMVPSTLGLKDETLVGLINRFNELQLERERMLRTTQLNNPLVQIMNEQLANLRVNILENLRNIKTGLLITSANLRANSGAFQSKIRRVPAMERKLLEISRQQVIKQGIYAYLLQKREETALSLAASASTARVLDAARSGDRPVGPNEQVIYLLAVLLGLSMPLAGIYLKGLLNNRVQSQEDVTDVVAVPIIGEVARSTGGAGEVSKRRHSPVAEMFRLIRANLHFTLMGQEHVVLMVTSSMSGEGKTFFSLNMGATLALTGKRVLLLDLDLRDPSIAPELSLSEQPGITDYLTSNTLTAGDLIRESGLVPNLFVISSGPVPPNPAELILSDKLGGLIAELKQHFDFIILDTPPLGQVADAFSVGAYADFTVYVVRYGYTYKAQLNIIRNIHRDNTLRNPLIVLNDAQESNGNNYGYGYHYGQQTNRRKAVAGR